MANTLITPQNVARAALASYQYNAVLPRVVNRNYVTEFGGGSGDTITIRKQATLSANLFDRATGIVAQDITEGSLTLTVSDIYDISAVITQEQWDMDLTDFNFQVSEPAGKAMVRRSEQVIAAKLAEVDGDRITAFDADKPLAAFIEARKQMNADEVPADGRVWVLGTDVAAALLGTDNLIKADAAGDAGALRSASIGRLLGCSVVESVVVPADAGYLVHRDAVTFVSITPSMPRGSANGSVESFDSQAMRVVFGYDQGKKQDTVSFDAYLQAEVIRPEGITGVTL
jgi:hypothetical protein